MNKKWFSIPLFMVFIFLNYYWLQYHSVLNIYKQILLIFTGIIIYLIAAIIYIVYAKDNRRRLIIYRILIIGLFSYYVIFLVSVLFLDGYFFSRGGMDYVNKVPFYTIKKYYLTMKNNNDLAAFANLMGNAILFAPMGLLLPLLADIFKNPYVFTLTMIFMVGMAEFSQYYFHVGGADIDDIILNVLGSLIVFMIYKILAYVLKDKIEVYFKNN